MSLIRIDQKNAERINEILSSVHAEAVEQGNTEYAQEIDALCGELHKNSDAPLLDDKSENGEYSLPIGKTCWITVGSASLYVNAQHEGVSVEIFPLNQEDDGEFASTHALYADLEAAI